MFVRAFYIFFSAFLSIKVHVGISTLSICLYQLLETHIFYIM